MKPKRIKLAVSSCLLGENVRYDGGNKYDACIAETFGEHFELIPICPEVGAGLAIPRPPIQLISLNNRIRAIGAEDPERDVSDRLTAFARQQVNTLDELCGYIFKSRSPSCGVTDTRIMTDHGEITGPGLYASLIMTAQPQLPVIDEQRLKSATGRDNFLERVFARHRWHCLHGA
ncbi:MAG: DUF523 domain-containing protein [Pseudomonadota bacterium]|nr:DUF523 domain-containing protein [Pseudomonadota bacterium]